MSAAITERIVGISQQSRMLPHGNKSEFYAKAAAELGISPATLHRKMNEVSVRPTRNRLPLGGKHWKPSRVEIGGEASQMPTTGAFTQGAKAVLDRMMKVIGTPKLDYAAALNVSPNTIKTWIHRGEVSFKFICEFAGKHGASVDYLMSGKE